MPMCDTCRTILDSECFDVALSRCPRCHLPKLCDTYKCPCENQDIYYDIFSIARYDGNLSYATLRALKIDGNKAISKVLSYYILKAMIHLGCNKNTIVVPVPCSKARLKKFGWDQMQLVAKHLPYRYENLLVNNINKGQQKKLSKSQRLEEAKAKFSINKKLLDKLSLDCEQKIVVIDDVTTTMATMKSAIDCLKGQGFNNVSGITWLYDWLPDKED